jgi:hypothetical protein
MKSSDKSVYAHVRKVHASLCMVIPDVERDLVQNNLQGVADTVYAMKEALKFVDHIKKEIGRVQKLAEKLCCLGWVTKGDGQPVRTDYCIGSPNVEEVPKTPKEGTEEYSQLIKYYGVPEGTPFRPHWPALLKRVSADLANGLPIPPGCDPNATWSVYSVTTRKKQPVLCDDETVDQFITDPDLCMLAARALREVAPEKYQELLLEQRSRDANAQPVNARTGMPDFAAMESESEEDMF